VRGSSGGVRAGGGRGGCLAAALIALAACGDNTVPRLAAARFVYDDGTEQIDRDQLYDRTLDTLCTPTVFSDGRHYCSPPTDAAWYFDANCTHAVGAVFTGTAPERFFETSYWGDGGSDPGTPSRVFRAGGRTAAPAQLYKKYASGCFGDDAPYKDLLDFYEVTELVELEPVKLEPWFSNAGFVVDVWRGRGLRVPTSIEDCDVVERPNESTTTCAATAPVSLFGDAACTQPIALGQFPPPGFTAFQHDEVSDCTSYFGAPEQGTLTRLYTLNGTSCQEQPNDSELVYPITWLAPIEPVPLTRSPVGAARLRLLRLGALPLFDELLHDDRLGADCRRDASGRCVPVTTAAVETWFADPACGQPIDVAMVRTGGCNTPMPVATTSSSRCWIPIRTSSISSAPATRVRSTTRLHRWWRIRSAQPLAKTPLLVRP
jgi:hypothetical protein